jgi:hypothetical protein
LSLLSRLQFTRARNGQKPMIKGWLTPHVLRHASPIVTTPPCPAELRPEHMRSLSAHAA